MTTKRTIKRWKTKRRKLATITPSDYNPREIDIEERARLQASLETFGQVQSIVVNLRTPEKGWPEESSPTVCGGHQKLDILLTLGETDADVTEVDLNEGHEQALNLALNDPNAQGRFTGGIETLLSNLKDSDDLYARLGLGALEKDTSHLFAARETTRLKPVDPMPPPKMAWTLIGVPLTRYDRVAEAIEQIAADPTTIVQSTVNEEPA